MNIEMGQHIKCILKNSTVVEGTVKEWSAKNCVLLSLDKKSLLIIPHPDEDIMLIKVMLGEIQNNFPAPIITKPQEVFEQVAKELHSDLKMKHLAELRLLEKEQDKKIIEEKLKEHSINEVKAVKYGYPGLFKK
jgi:hypothetical protein